MRKPFFENTYKQMKKDGVDSLAWAAYLFAKATDAQLKQMTDLAVEQGMPVVEVNGEQFVQFTNGLLVRHQS